jgi:hypothetical protein
MAAPETVHGWKQIAAILGVSVRCAQDRAAREVDPVPVRMGHAGVWCYTSALRDWIHRQDMDYQVALRLRSEANSAARRRGGTSPAPR